MLEKLKNMIGRIMPDVDCSNVNEDTKLFEDLHFDSLALMMLSINIEQEFDITFTEAVTFKTVGDVIKFLEEKGK